MRLLFKITAFVMLALWLPATNHCDLEAVGIQFLTHCDHDGASCKDVCTDDACHSLENASYSKDACMLKVLPPPVLRICLLQFLPPPVLANNFAVYTADDPPEVQLLHRTWQFVRRTALPARAPDFVA